jgi:hypothetical protein
MTLPRAFLRFLCLLAFGGLGASLVVHLATLRGVGLQARDPYVWILHVGAMVVFFPALLIGRGLAGTFRPDEYARRAFRYAPASYRRATAVLVGYAGVSSFACLVLLNSGPARYLTAQGGDIDSLRALEFRSGQIYGLRLFSCAWIAAYAIALAILISARNAPDAE